MRIGWGDERELVDEGVCDVFVVLWELDARLGAGGARAGTGEDAACVEVDGCFVDVG